MKNLFSLLLLASILFLNIPTLYAQIKFEYTGDVQYYTVPEGVTEIRIEAYGAQGGGEYGGKGGYAEAIVPVKPGVKLQIYVGGQPEVQQGPGGFNGGGSIEEIPCGGSSDGWPGGGASDVRTSSDLGDRIIVAGGGGGQGWSRGEGGEGGGLHGGDGDPSWIKNTHGQGGTQTKGGVGGDYGDVVDSPAPDGTFGKGGDSSPKSTYCTGGGGGGGWYGGGGGYVSGGGGGSSYIDYPGTKDASTESGVNEGHGYIIISDGVSKSTKKSDVNLNGVAANGPDKPSVFPNPSGNSVKIECKGPFKYAVINSEGRIVFDGTGTNEKEINIGDLKAGVYFIEIVAEDKRNVVKILKE